MEAKLCTGMDGDSSKMYFCHLKLYISSSVDYIYNIFTGLSYCRTALSEEELNPLPVLSSKPPNSINKNSHFTLQNTGAFELLLPQSAS